MCHCSYEQHLVWTATQHSTHVPRDPRHLQTSHNWCNAVVTREMKLSQCFISQVTPLALTRSEAHVCLWVCGAPWWVLSQHSLRLFFIVKYGIVHCLCAMHLLEVRAQQPMTLSDLEWLFHASHAISVVAELLVCWWQNVPSCAVKKCWCY